MEQDQHMQALRLAVQRGLLTRKQADVAQALDVSQQTISRFMGGKPIGQRTADKLTSWLLEQDLWHPEAPQPDNPKSPRQAIATDIRAMASTLDSGLPGPMVEEKFLEFVRYYAKHIEALAAAIKDQSP